MRLFCNWLITVMVTNEAYPTSHHDKVAYHNCFDNAVSLLLVFVYVWEWHALFSFQKWVDKVRTLLWLLLRLLKCTETSLIYMYKLSSEEWSSRYMLCCQLFWTHYQTVWFENFFWKAIVQSKWSEWKNIDNFLYEGNLHRGQPPNQHFLLSANGA